MPLEESSYQGDIDVPFVSSSEAVIHKMLEVIELKPDDILFDLGCGDGRVIIMAAQTTEAKCIGVERRKELAFEASKKVKDLNLSRRTAVIFGDLFSLDLRSADVVISYLLTAVNKKLAPKLEKELKLKARVISHDFEFPDWKPTKFIMLDEGLLDHKIYLYVKEDPEGFEKKKEEPEPSWKSL
nr:class I SAM-dependent methyltransferase [Candidatus Njordarchaeum guaymaensis]